MQVPAKEQSISLMHALVSTMTARRSTIAPQTRRISAAPDAMMICSKSHPEVDVSVAPTTINSDLGSMQERSPKVAFVTRAWAAVDCQPHCPTAASASCRSETAITSREGLQTMTLFFPLVIMKGLRRRPVKPSGARPSPRRSSAEPQPHGLPKRSPLPSLPFFDTRLRRSTCWCYMAHLCTGWSQAFTQAVGPLCRVPGPPGRPARVPN